MKKVIIIALALAALSAGAVSVSAKCMPCADTDCTMREYCMEECINNDCALYNGGTYERSRMGRRGHRSRYCCVNDEYCRYK